MTFLISDRSAMARKRPRRDNEDPEEEEGGTDPEATKDSTDSSELSHSPEAEE